MVTVPAARTEAPRAYLDHAATTALRPEVRDAYLEACDVLGNPTSVHASGRRARAVLDHALDSLCEDLDVPHSWIVLTSGGTEADNLALRGAGRGRLHADPSRSAVLVCATDHAAVVQTADSLQPEIAARVAPVGPDGILDLAAAEELLSDDAVSVASAALVNNETGIIQDVDGLAELARAHDTLVHTDAVQGLGHTSLPSWDSVDLISLSGHKIGAPVGVGALVAKPEVAFTAGSTGGGQQRGIRSGTLDAAHAAAFAAAVHVTLADAEAEQARVRDLSARLREGLRRIDPEVRFTAGESTPQTGHIVHVIFAGAHHDSLLYLLDERGVDASTGSACSAGVHRGSHVLEAMGVDPGTARGALRLSLGWSSTEADVDQVLAALPEALRRARAVGDLFA